MKPLYRCEECSFTGTAEEVAAHEETCSYVKRTCATCGNCDAMKSFKENRVICTAEIDVPEGQMFVHCAGYIRRDNYLNALFGEMHKH